MRHLKIPACLLVLLFVISLLPVAAFAAPEETNETVIHLFHTNDVHGHAAGNEDSVGYARFKTYIKEDTADGKLILDAGDAFSGSAFANLSDGQSIAQTMNAVSYNALVPGSHDFEYGSTQLSQLVSDSGANGLAFNIFKDGQPMFAPYHIFQKSGLKIAVIGVASPDTPSLVDPEKLEGANFLGKEETLVEMQSIVADLQAQNVNAIIALTHLGTGVSSLTSMDIATQVSGLDLIIDGNSHDAYKNGFVEYPGFIPGTTPLIAQTGKDFETFGVASLSFDEKGSLLSVSDTLVDFEQASTYAPDKGINSIISGYIKEQQPVLEQEVASTPVFLNGEEAFVRTGSCNFGTLAATVMKESTSADIAILNSGSIRSSLPDGPVSFGALYNALPFDQYIVTTTITGAELKALLNRQMVYEKSSFPQIAGFTVSAQKTLTAEGNDGAIVTTLSRDGKVISDSETLTVAILDYMYHGGDDYSFDAPVSKEYSTLFQAVVDYLSTAPPEAIESFSAQNNMIIWEETIDADNMIKKLKLEVPADIDVYLNQASIVPESVLYNLIGQNRTVSFHVQNERPYAFVFYGNDIPSPMNANLTATVSQEVPEGKRPASSADKNAIFVNLSKNQALPPGTEMSLYVGDVYTPGSFVYLYYYDINRDILPLNTDGIEVDSNGMISFSIVGDTTYLINSRLLNASTLFEAPTPSKPFVPGIIVVLFLFGGWVIFFLITKKGRQTTEK